MYADRERRCRGAGVEVVEEIGSVSGGLAGDGCELNLKIGSVILETSKG